ncbi:MAG: helix-turn-helix domain-containing protein [Pseudomonadota bacterium]
MSVKPLTTALNCLHLMEVLSEQPAPLRLADVARLIGESRATTYQRLLTLVTAGWMEHTEHGTYRLTVRALRIASGALEQAGLGERVVPILNTLTTATRQTSSLVLAEGPRIYIAQRVEARGVLRADLNVGTELSIRESPSGMVWTAFGPPSFRASLQESGTETAPENRLREVRQAGYAAGGGGETLLGIRGCAVPVLNPGGTCIASISLFGPEETFDPDAAIPALRAAAAALAAMF